MGAMVCCLLLFWCSASLLISDATMIPPRPRVILSRRERCESQRMWEPQRNKESRQEQQARDGNRIDAELSAVCRAVYRWRAMTARNTRSCYKLKVAQGGAAGEETEDRRVVLKVAGSRVL